jgi:hypothetical protein
MKKVAFILTFVILACSQKQPVKQPSTESDLKASFSGTLIADTIIYDVIIRNTNPDDTWAENCLKGLKRGEFVDSIFAWVYSGKISAYDFDTHVALKKKDIQKLESEKDFARDKIGKIQFKERWFFDSGKLTMSKEILSIVLGYEVYDDAGELRGYKPVFLILLNKT